MSQPAEQTSLQQQFDALHAHRVATMKPEDLQVNVDQRRQLVDTADRAGFVKAGDTVAPFVLEEVDGARLTLDDLVADGPVVLVFFRFAGCPACNIALPHYDGTLAPGLKAAGARLVAVSPQVPAKLADIKTRHGLSFEVASDRDNALARRFGILFEANEASKAASLAKGTALGEVTGTGTWELPMPTVVVIDRDRTVRFAAVSPDWLSRSEAEPILAAVTALSAARRAA